MATDWEKIAAGLKQYRWIMENLQLCDVSVDREFQKRFTYFYRIRQRTPEYYECFYSKLQASKHSGNASFGEVLDYFWEKLGRVEASFSSKLVATINPEMPVWDKEVLRNLGLKKPLYSDRNRLNKTKRLYDSIVTWYRNYLKTEKCQLAIETFDQKFPDSGISDVKKIDLILWQTRHR